MANFSTTTASDHHRTSLTARLISYYRSFSDIPYAQEASKRLRGEEAAREILGEDLELVTRYSVPFMEARYKCFDRFIGARSNVLELAVGTSVERGLSISDDPEKIYVGTDLPGMITDAKAFFDEINEKIRTNHHLKAANVVSYEELQAAAYHFGARKELTIINEGLWYYLTNEEQLTCAENIRRLLEHYGGQWVTPDITDLESGRHDVASLELALQCSYQRIMRRIESLTGRDLEKNSFPSRQHAIAFFEKCGFTVTQYPMLEGLRHLTSIENMWGNRERSLYEPILSRQLVWVMST